MTQSDASEELNQHLLVLVVLAVQDQVGLVVVELVRVLQLVWKVVKGQVVVDGVVLGLVRIIVLVV